MSAELPPPEKLDSPLDVLAEYRLKLAEMRELRIKQQARKALLDPERHAKVFTRLDKLFATIERTFEKIDAILSKHDA